MRKGFSLVELSIVLVILGLLVGGILAGQSLIRASELRSVSTDVGRFQTAMRAFQDKYFALPGDMSNATSFWGEDAAKCDTAAADGAPGTCNGNANGQLNNAAVVNGTGEIFQFWKQLALAGLIEGTYSGTAGGVDVANSVHGTNTPRSRISNAGYSLIYLVNPTDNVIFFGTPSMNILEFGSMNGNASLGDALKADEAWNIDIKMDDGRPGIGAYKTPTATNVNGGIDCATTSVGSTAEYDLTKTVIACAFLIKLGA